MAFQTWKVYSDNKYIDGRKLVSLNSQWINFSVFLFSFFFYILHTYNVSSPSSPHTYKIYYTNVCLYGCTVYIAYKLSPHHTDVVSTEWSECRVKKSEFITNTFWCAQHEKPNFCSTSTILLNTHTHTTLFLI